MKKCCARRGGDSIWFSHIVRQERRIIGITGVMPGIGVTHLSLALANYSAAHQRRKTAVIELSGAQAMEAIGHSKEPYTLNCVTYYPHWSCGRLPELLISDYETLILDLGNTYYRIRKELLRCDKKMIVGSLSAWRKAEYYNYLRYEMEDDLAAESVVLLTRNGIKKDKKEMKKEFGLPVCVIPEMPDPFALDRQNYEFLKNLL